MTACTIPRCDDGWCGEAKVAVGQGMWRAWAAPPPKRVTRVRPPGGWLLAAFATVALALGGQHDHGCRGNTRPAPRPADALAYLTHNGKLIRAQSYVTLPRYHLPPRPPLCTHSGPVRRRPRPCAREIPLHRKSFLAIRPAPARRGARGWGARALSHGRRPCGAREDASRGLVRGIPRVRELRVFT